MKLQNIERENKKVHLVLLQILSDWICLIWDMCNCAYIQSMFKSLPYHVVVVQMYQVWERVPTEMNAKVQKGFEKNATMMRVLNSASAKSWQRFNGLIHLRRSKLWFQLPTWESRSLCTYYPIPCHVKVRIQWHVDNMLVKILKYIELNCSKKNCPMMFHFCSSS